MKNKSSCSPDVHPSTVQQQLLPAGSLFSKGYSCCLVKIFPLPVAAAAAPAPVAGGWLAEREPIHHPRCVEGLVYSLPVTFVKPTAGLPLRSVQLAGLLVLWQQAVELCPSQGLGLGCQHARWAGWHARAAGRRVWWVGWCAFSLAQELLCSRQICVDSSRP